MSVSLPELRASNVFRDGQSVQSGRRHGFYAADNAMSATPTLLKTTFDGQDWDLGVELSIWLQLAICHADPRKPLCEHRARLRETVFSQ